MRLAFPFGVKGKTYKIVRGISVMRVHVSVCVCVRVRAHARACVRACVVCVQLCMHVFIYARAVECVDFSFRI